MKKEDYESRERVAPQASQVTSELDIPECICAGNFRNIVAETYHLIGKKFKDADGKIYVYFGVVYGADDLYYGMSDMENKCSLLSCVGSFEIFGFEEVYHASNHKQTS